MGWTFPYTPPADPKAELDRLHTWTNDGGSRRVLKSAFVGATYYAAVEHRKPDGSIVVWGAVVLTSRERGKWGYKEMDETMGPYESKCPLSIIALLSPTDSQNANDWRQRCIRHAESRQTKRKAGVGDVVVYGGVKYRLDGRVPYNPRLGWNVTRISDGMPFRMKSHQFNASTPA